MASTSAVVHPEHESGAPVLHCGSAALSVVIKNLWLPENRPLFPSPGCLWDRNEQGQVRLLQEKFFDRSSSIRFAEAVSFTAGFRQTGVHGPIIGPFAEHV